MKALKSVRYALAGAALLLGMAGSVKGKTIDEVVAQEGGRTVRVKVEDDFNHAPLDSAIVRFICQNDTSIAYSDTTDSSGIVEFEDFNTSIPDNTDVPLDYKLKQNYPNPFNPSTIIPIDVDKYTDVNLSIYNIRGQLVKTLHNGNLAPGEHQYTWDGTDNNGTGVAAGMYIAMMDNGESIKMMLLDGNTSASPRVMFKESNNEMDAGRWYDTDVSRNNYESLSDVVFVEEGEGVIDFVYRLTRNNEEPVIDADITPKEAAVGDTVTFKDVGSYDPDNDPFSFDWETEGQHYYTPDARHAYETEGEKTVTLTVTDERGAAVDTSYTVQINPLTEKTFQAVIVDNRTLEKVVNGIIEVNGHEYETDNSGMVNVSVDPSVTKLDSVKAWTVDSDTASSFVVTYRDVPMDSSWTTPVGLMITTYDSLTNVEEALRVNPQLFRDFMQEGNMGYSWAPAHGLRSIDFQNAQNPVPNPDGEHGYVYWIDRDYGYRTNPDKYGIFSQEEQLYIKDVIEREIMSNIRDTTHKPQIYVAQPGENPQIKQGGTNVTPDYGTLFVTHRLGGNGYQFGWYDHDNDGIIDAAQIRIGDPTNLDAKISQEAGSIIVLNPIYNKNMDGKTNFSERAVTGYLSPADLKALGIEENVSRDMQWQVTQLPSGLYVVRGHYKPLTKIDDILKIQ